ncbi:endochitinase A [Lingula anatina]|uniref:Endochitinase A n=1 Tax=Lingula anatina TaxID=7574 RepID=A0A1S3JQ46_LINAN|nr:endochitinase A [Lingula anatina]|eukprot:XP_013412470.1 endochitinase A [Lingula anatina]
MAANGWDGNLLFFVLHLLVMQSEMVQLPCPVGHWQLGDPAEALDLSGNGNHMVYTGTVTTASGPHGGNDLALHFNSGAYGTIPNNGVLDVTDALTIMSVVYPENDNDFPIFEYEFPTGALNGFMIWKWGGHYEFHTIPRGTTIHRDFVSSSPWDLPVNQWSFLAATYSKAQEVVKLYKNETLLTSQNIVPRSLETSRDIHVARRAHGTCCTETSMRFRGKMACFVVFDVALTVHELREAWKLCSAHPPPGYACGLLSPPPEPTSTLASHPTVDPITTLPTEAPSSLSSITEEETPSTVTPIATTESVDTISFGHTTSLTAQFSSSQWPVSEISTEMSSSALSQLGVSSLGTSSAIKLSSVVSTFSTKSPSVDSLHISSPSFSDDVSSSAQMPSSPLPAKSLMSTPSLTSASLRTPKQSLPSTLSGVFSSTFHSSTTVAQETLHDGNYSENMLETLHSSVYATTSQLPWESRANASETHVASEMSETQDAIMASVTQYTAIQSSMSSLQYASSSEDMSENPKWLSTNSSYENMPNSTAVQYYINGTEGSDFTQTSSTTDSFSQYGLESVTLEDAQSTVITVTTLLTGANTTLTETALTSTPAPARCALVEDVPNTVHNASYVQYSQGTLVMFTCTGNTTFIDGTTSRSITCRSTGKWSKIIPPCTENAEEVQTLKVARRRHPENPKEAPGAPVIGTFGLALLLGTVFAIVALDLISVHRHLKPLRRNLRRLCHKVNCARIPKSNKYVRTY